MSDSVRTHQIKDTIRNHLATVGATRWKAVRLQCPEISEATFWRYVKAVREEWERTTVPDETPPLERPDPHDGVPRVGELPAFYNPLQKARQYEALLADAEVMRSRSLDYRGKVTNLRMLERSILLRERLLRQQAAVMGYFQNQEAMKLFYDELIEIASDLPRETVLKLMTRLHELQQRRLAASGS
jgi:hypothetical protein